MPSPQTIRRATENDVARIHKLAAGLKLSEKSNGSSAHGFLVSNYSAADYAEYLDRTEHFHVLEADGKIVAFLLAISGEAIQPDQVVENLIKFSYAAKFLIIKQIAVDPQHDGQGFGSALYDHLIATMPDTALFASIVAQPRNERSLAFHEKFKFKLYMNADGADGMPRMVFIRYGSAGANQTRLRWCSTSSEVTSLQSYYEEAIKLYCHEDNLNWAKLGAFFTVTVLLFAGLAHVWQGEPKLRNDDILIWGLFGLGTVTFAVFWASIWGGLSYLAARKNSAIEYEQVLQLHDPLGFLPIVSLKAEVSRTAQVIKWIPVFSLLAWMAASVALLWIE